LTDLSKFKFVADQTDHFACMEAKRQTEKEKRKREIEAKREDF